MSAFDLIDRAAEWRVPVVQIADNMPLQQLSDGEVQAIARHAGARDVTIELGTVGFRPDHLARQIEIATMLGSPLLRVVIDTPEDHPDAREVVRRLHGLLAPLEAAAVSLLIENHDRFQASELAAILRKTEHELVGACFDTVNSLGVPETWEAVMDELAPWIGNVHAKEFAITRVANRMGFDVAGAPLGEGKLDLGKLVSRLERGPRDLTIVLEQWSPFVGDIAATIENEARWAQRSIGVLTAAMPPAKSVAADIGETPAPTNMRSMQG